jgi:hypothetical protein
VADHPEDPTPDEAPEAGPEAGPLDDADPGVATSADPAGAAESEPETDPGEAAEQVEPAELVEPDADPGEAAELVEPEATATAEIADEDAEPEATATAEIAAEDAEPDVTAQAGVVGDDGGAGADGGEGEATGDGDGDGRARWVVPVVVGVVVVVVLAVVGLGVLVGGDDGGAGPEEVAGQEDGGDGGDATDTTVGTGVPPVTTGPDAPPTAGLLSEIEPVDSDTWEPGDDGVTIGGAAYDQTVVSGPIGTCDDGAAQSVTYDLAGGYTWLDGVVGLADGTATGLTVEVGFEADGEQVWWKTFAEGESTRVQLDLTGARELTVTATGLFPGRDAAEGCVQAAYGDLTLR